MKGVWWPIVLLLKDVYVCFPKSKLILLLKLSCFVERKKLGFTNIAFMC